MSGPNRTRARGAGRKGAVVTVEGDMTIVRATELAATFSRAIRRGRRLDVNLERVTELDGAGVQLLLATKKSAESKGAGLLVTQVSAEVRGVLALLGLEHLVAEHGREGSAS